MFRSARAWAVVSVRPKRELVRLVRRADGVVVFDACGRRGRPRRLRVCRRGVPGARAEGRTARASALRGSLSPGRRARARECTADGDDRADDCRSQEVRGTVAAAKIKVIELAKELGVTSKDLMVAAEEMGHKGVRAMTPLDQKLANELRVKLGKGRELPEEPAKAKRVAKPKDGAGDRRPTAGRSSSRSRCAPRRRPTRPPRKRPRTPGLPRPRSSSPSPSSSTPEPADRRQASAPRSPLSRRDRARAARSDRAAGPRRVPEPMKPAAAARRATLRRPAASRGRASPSRRSFRSGRWSARRRRPRRRRARRVTRQARSRSRAITQGPPRPVGTAPAAASGAARRAPRAGGRRECARAVSAGRAVPRSSGRPPLR